MRPARRLLAGLACAVLVSCSKTESPSNQPDMTSYLPGDTIAFAAGDIQDASMQALLKGPGYTKYMQGMMVALEQNKEVGDYSTYIDVMKALGFMPGADGKISMPYGKVVYFARPAEKGVAVAAYANMAGDDGKKVLGRVKAVLDGKKIATTEVKGNGYEGFQFKPFDGQSNPDIDAYRESTGVDTLFLVASEAKIVAASSKDLLDRAFAAPANEFANFLASDKYKKTVAAAGQGGSSPIYGALDVEQLAKRLGTEPAKIAELPISVVAFNGVASATGMGMSLASMIEPKTEEQKQVLGAIPAGSGKALFAKLPQQVGVALSIDGPALRKAVEVSSKDAPPEQTQMVNQILGSVQSINIGIASPTSGSPYPDITIAFLSSDADALAETLKGLTAMAPMPGMEWQDSTVEGVKMSSMPTPLGIKVNVASAGGAVVISTNQAAITTAAKSQGSDSLSSSALVASAMNTMKSAALGVYVDYPQLARIAADALQAAAMFAPQGSDLPTNQLEQLKYMGKVALAAGYEAGILRMSFGQEFTQ